MAKKENKPRDEEIHPVGPTEMEPVEFFEIESLNADALDIEELESRLEMAATITDLGLYCGADCGSNCVGNCGTNCIGNCGTNCQADCGGNCGIDLGCETDGCGTMQIP